MLNPVGGITAWDATRGTKRADTMRAAVDFKDASMLASRKKTWPGLRNCGCSSGVIYTVCKNQGQTSSDDATQTSGFHIGGNLETNTGGLRMLRSGALHSIVFG